MSNCGPGQVILSDGCCNYCSNEIIVEFPKINFDECCGSVEEKNTFLEECSKTYAPAQCVDVTKGSAIVVMGGDTADVEKKVATNSLEPLIVGAISYDTSGGFLIDRNYLKF